MFGRTRSPTHIHREKHADAWTFHVSSRLSHVSFLFSLPPFSVFERKGPSSCTRRRPSPRAMRRLPLVQCAVVRFAALFLLLSLALFPAVARGAAVCRSDGYDLIVVLDGSGSTQPAFANLRSFLKTIADSATVAPERFRLGLGKMRIIAEGSRGRAGLYWSGWIWNREWAVCGSIAARNRTNTKVYWSEER